MLAKFEEALEILETSGEIEALRFASKLNCLGTRRDEIQKAWSAHRSPEFYRELGQSPEEIVERGLKALREILSQG